MKLIKLLFSLFMFLAFFQSCQDDISELENPRDKITKEWRVVESGGREYTAKIIPDGNDVNMIYIENFHDLNSTQKLHATVVDKNITITDQTLDAIDNFTDAQGTISSNFDEIVFTYYWDDGNAAPEQFTATFGPMPTVKKKSAKPAL